MERQPGSTSRRAQRHVLAAALLGVFVPLFPVLIVIAALPDMADDFGTSQATIAWVLTAPLLVGSAVLPTIGRLGDLYGHRRVFLVGLTCSGLFALGAALAWNPISLIVFRSLSQASGTGVSPSAIALVISSSAPEDRTKVLGFWATSTAIAPALGLLAGGPAVDVLSWRGLFVIQAAVALLVVPYGYRVLRETSRGKVQFDFAGGAAFTTMSAAAVFALDRAGRWGWRHPAVAASFVVSAIGAVTFVRVERRVSSPMLPPALLRHRSFMSACSCELFVQISSNLALFVLPLLLREGFDTSVGRTSWVLAGLPIGMAITAPFGGRLAKRTGERSLAIVGGALLAVAMFAVVAADRQGWLVAVVAAWTLTGLANGLIRPAISSSAAAALDPNAYGAGMAATRMVSTVGAAAGVTLAISLLPLGGTHLGLVAAGVAAMGCAAVGLGLARSR